MWGSYLIWFNLQKPCRYFIVLWRLLHFVVLHVCGFHRLTSRKSCSFMAMCKLHSKESNKGMNVIVSPTVQLKRCTERQILFFDCVQVNFLKMIKGCWYKSSTLTMNCQFKSFQFYERNEDTTLMVAAMYSWHFLYLMRGNNIFKPVQLEYQDENVHQQQHSIVSHKKIKESPVRPQI